MLECKKKYRFEENGVLWDRNKWQYDIACKRRDVTRGWKNKKKVKKKTTACSSYLLPSTRNRERHQLSTSHCFLRSSSSLAAFHWKSLPRSCRCCPLLESPRINCPLVSISHRSLPSPPTTKLDSSHENKPRLTNKRKKKKKYLPNYNEDNLISK